MITTMDKQTATYIQKRMMDSLKGLGEELGINFGLAGGTIGTANATLKISATLKTAGASPGEVNFKKYAKIYGLEESDLGRVVALGNKKFKITGINPNAPKYAIEATNLNGKGYRIPTEAVLKALGRGR